MREPIWEVAVKTINGVPVWVAPNTIGGGAGWGAFNVSATDNKSLLWTGDVKNSGKVRVRVRGKRSCGPGGGGGGGGGGAEEDEFIASWDVEVLGVFRGTSARACAGAVADDDVHSFALKIKGAAGAQLALSFANNVGQPKKAMFIVGGVAAETITVTMNADGDPTQTVKVLSSDTISQPDIVAQQAGTEVGRITCDFAEAQSARRYGIIELNQGYGGDHGWDFDPEFLFDYDDRANATLYLRFRKDPNKAVDQKYFLINGNKVSTIDTNNDFRISDTEMAAAQARDSEEHPTTPTLKLDDADNWLPVNGHDLRISIGEVIANGATVPPTRDYVYFVNAAGQPIDQNGNSFPDPTTFVLPAFVPAATADRGTTKKEKGVTLPIYLRAGPLINQVTSLSLYVTDTTQKNP